MPVREDRRPVPPAAAAASLFDSSARGRTHATVRFSDASLEDRARRTVTSSDLRRNPRDKGSVLAVALRSQPCRSAASTVTLPTPRSAPHAYHPSGQESKAKVLPPNHLNKGRPVSAGPQARFPGMRRDSEAVVFCGLSFWEGLLRFVLSLSLPFSPYIKSCFASSPPVSSQNSLPSTSALWPLPPPYPDVWRKVGSTIGRPPLARAERAMQLAINLIACVLSWLYLRKPRHAPSSGCLGTVLTAPQRDVVGRLRRLLLAWSETQPLRSTDLGRTSCKVENMEETLQGLFHIASTLHSGLNPYGNSAHPPPPTTLSLRVIIIGIRGVGWWPTWGPPLWRWPRK